MLGFIMKKHWLVSVFALWPLAASAQPTENMNILDRLYPVESRTLWGNLRDYDYATLLIAAFGEAYREDVRVRVFAFAPQEFVVGISGQGSSYKIFSVESKVSLDAYAAEHRGQAIVDVAALSGLGAHLSSIEELRAALPPVLSGDNLQNCEVDLDAPTALGIVQVWGEMLERRGPNVPQTAADSVYFRFSTFQGAPYRPMEGEAFGGNPGPNISGLIDIALTMRQMCKSGDVSLQSVLGGKVSDLLSRLEPE